MSRIDFGSKVYFIEPFDKCFVSAGDSGVIINLYNESYVLILDKNDKSIRVMYSVNEALVLFKTGNKIAFHTWKHEYIILTKNLQARNQDNEIFEEFSSINEAEEWFREYDVELKEVEDIGNKKDSHVWFIVQ